MRFFICILQLLLILACSHSTNKENVLAVTAEPYRFVVEEIAGEQWQVVTIVPKGGNPETFEPSPASMAALSGCKAYFMAGGLGFENVWKDKIVDIYPAIRLVDTSKGISRHMGDPHLWTSPDNMILIARNVCDALCSIDAAKGDDYRLRLNTFVQSVQETDSLVAAKLSDCDKRDFVIFHPTLTYFANRYSLNQIAIEHEGKEPSVQQMRCIVDSARACGVGIVLLQEEFDRRSAQAIADEIGARVVSIDPLAYDWHTQMLHIATVLSND